jgi:tryptophan-rich sensory protein
MTLTLKREHTPLFIGFYALCLIVQVAGAYFTDRSVHTWYPTLDKSPLTPPGVWFGIVWTTLYLLMALAATRVSAVIRTLRNRPLAWWAIQLILGLIWSIMFFGNQSVLGGLIIISATIVAVIVTTTLFWRVNAWAGIMMMPLTLWLTLATHLNLYIYLHN